MCLTPSFRVFGRVGADITVLREREVDYDSDVPRKITEVLVRKVPDNQQVGTCDLAVLSCWRLGGFIQAASFWDGSPNPRGTLSSAHSRCFKELLERDLIMLFISKIVVEEDTSRGDCLD